MSVWCGDSTRRARAIILGSMRLSGTTEFGDSWSRPAPPDRDSPWPAQRRTPERTSVSRAVCPGYPRRRGETRRSRPRCCGCRRTPWKASPGGRPRRSSGREKSPSRRQGLRSQHDATCSGCGSRSAPRCFSPRRGGTAHSVGDRSVGTPALKILGLHRRKQGGSQGRG